MLGRDHHRGGADRPAGLVAQADLALGIGSETRHLAGMPRPREVAQDRVRVVDRGWHQHVGLAAGMAEHEPLVACAHVAGIVARLRIHSLGNVLRLRVQVCVDRAGPPVKPVLLVAHPPDGLPHRVDDPGRNPVRPAHLAGEHDPVGGGQRLAGNPAVGVGREVQIDHGIGNEVADLVRVTFRHRFTGKYVTALGHRTPPLPHPAGDPRLSLLNLPSTVKRISGPTAHLYATRSTSTRPSRSVTIPAQALSP